MCWCVSKPKVSIAYVIFEVSCVLLNKSTLANLLWKVIIKLCVIRPQLSQTINSILLYVTVCVLNKKPVVFCID